MAKLLLLCAVGLLLAVPAGAKSHYMNAPERYQAGSGGHAPPAQCQEWWDDAETIAYAKHVLAWPIEKLQGNLKPATEIGEEDHARMMQWIDEAYALPEGAPALRAWVKSKVDACMLERT